MKGFPKSMQRSTALMLIGGGIAAAARPAQAQSALPVVRIGAQTIDATGEPYYGRDAGIFAQNGVDVQVTSMSNGAAIVQGVLNGDLDVGLSNPLPIAIAISRGLPLQMLVPACLYSKKMAYGNLVVAKDSPIKTAKDLEGKTIGVGSLGDYNQLSAWWWLEKNGVPRDRVQFVEIPLSSAGAALEHGTVQAAFTAEPLRSQFIKAGQIRDFADTYLAVAPETAVVVFFSSKAWLAKNGELAKKLIAGIYATARYANTRPQDTVASFARFSKLDPSVIASIPRAYFATENDPKYVRDILQLANKYGMLQRPVSFAEYSWQPS